MNGIEYSKWNALTAVLGGILIVSFAQNACAGETNEVFMKSCASCHGKDGRADTPVAKKLGVKDLSQSKLTDAQIEQQIRDGKQENQTVTKMPAFKDRLTDEEVKSLVSVVKGFRK